LRVVWIPAKDNRSSAHESLRLHPVRSEPIKKTIAMNKTRFRKRQFALWAGLAAAALLAACATPTARSAPQTPWYEVTTGAYKTDAGRMFYGIGIADPSKNRSLQRVNVDNGARRELAELIDQYTRALAVTAIRTGGPGLKALAADEVQAALNSVVRQVVRRAVVADHWIDAQSGRMKALCTFDLPQYQAVLAKNTSLNPRLRSAMLDHAEMLYTQLAGNLQ
jgi:hypothetical protein